MARICLVKTSTSEFGHVFSAEGRDFCSFRASLTTVAPWCPIWTRFLNVLTPSLCNSDYAVNEALDRYSDADLDDNEDVPELSAAQRRAAEAKMARRDRLERRGGRGARASRRTRYPGFLESDDMEDEDMEDGGLLSQMKRRTRRQYDERKDMDDLDGVEDVSNSSC